MAVFDFLPGTTPPGEHLAELDTYTPVLSASTTNPNLGADGEAVGVWYRSGRRLITVWGRFLLAGTGANVGSGFYDISVPIPIDTSFHEISGSNDGPWHALGSAHLRDATTGANTRVVTIAANTATTVRMANPGANSMVNNTHVPGLNRVRFQFEYLAEPGT